jgi:hypothetical protein
MAMGVPWCLIPVMLVRIDKPRLRPEIPHGTEMQESVEPE